MVEGTAPTTPASGRWRLFVDVADGLLKLVDDAGAVTAIGGSAATHIADTSAAHAASSIGFTPVGTVAATDVQAAIAEVASEATASGVTASENFLTSPVTIASANTFYDGPSLSLVAGTYVLMGVLVFTTSAGGAWFTAKLWDGASDVLNVTENRTSDATGVEVLPVMGYVVVGSTTTYKISGAANVGSSQSSILDTGNHNGTTDKASKLVALRIA
jgi:hypothetical protein